MLVYRKRLNWKGFNPGIQFPGLTPRETLDKYTGKQTVNLSCSFTIVNTPNYSAVKKAVNNNLNSPFVKSTLLCKSSDVQNGTFTITNIVSDDPYLLVIVYPPHPNRMIQSLFLHSGNIPVYYTVEVSNNNQDWNKCLMAFCNKLNSTTQNNTNNYVANWFSEPNLFEYKRVNVDYFQNKTTAYSFWFSSIRNCLNFKSWDPIMFRFTSYKTYNDTTCGNWGRMSHLQINY